MANEKFDRNLNALNWAYSDEDDVWRAYDDHALYVIFGSESDGYNVGYFAAAGPEASWATGLMTLEDAQASAQECAEFVKEFKERLKREGS